MRTFLVGLLFISFTLGCHTKRYTLETLPKTYIEFGSNSDNSGARISWVFLRNGQVFYKTNLFSTPQKDLPKTEVDEIFKEAESVKKTGYQFKEVGVTTGFITLKDKDHLREVSWTWPYGGTKPVPDELSKLYGLLLKASKDAAQEYKLD
ncbi:MAG: hypothetical protein FGM41_10610 [Bacteroidetes bacterium]|nr:hypothetical protein [Bacteroidota bacterium]